MTCHPPPCPVRATRGCPCAGGFSSPVRGVPTALPSKPTRCRLCPPFNRQLSSVPHKATPKSSSSSGQPLPSAQKGFISTPPHPPPAFNFYFSGSNPFTPTSQAAPGARAAPSRRYLPPPCSCQVRPQNPTTIWAGSPPPSNFLVSPEHLTRSGEKKKKKNQEWLCPDALHNL